MDGPDMLAMNLCLIYVHIYWDMIMTDMITQTFSSENRGAWPRDEVGGGQTHCTDGICQVFYLISILISTLQIGR